MNYKINGNKVTITLENEEFGMFSNSLLYCSDTMNFRLYTEDFFKKEVTYTVFTAKEQSSFTLGAKNIIELKLNEGKYLVNQPYLLACVNDLHDVFEDFIKTEGMHNLFVTKECDNVLLLHSPSKLYELKLEGESVCIPEYQICYLDSVLDVEVYTEYMQKKHTSENCTMYRVTGHGSVFIHDEKIDLEENYISSSFGGRVFVPSSF